MIRKIFVLFIFFYIYALVRYQVGMELWEFWDYIYTINKALAWLAGTLLGMTLFKDEVLNKYKLTRKTLGVSGYFLAIFHITLSFCLLSPTYYSSFFENGILNGNGYTNIVIGVLSFSFFSLALFGSIQWLPSTYIRFGKIGVILNFMHVFNIGFLHWFPINEWLLFMPPITLIFILELLLIFGLRYLFLNKVKN